MRQLASNLQLPRKAPRQHQSCSCPIVIALLSLKQALSMCQPPCRRLLSCKHAIPKLTPLGSTAALIHTPLLRLTPRKPPLHTELPGEPAPAGKHEDPSSLIMVAPLGCSCAPPMLGTAPDHLPEFGCLASALEVADRRTPAHASRQHCCTAYCTGSAAQVELLPAFPTCSPNAHLHACWVCAHCDCSARCVTVPSSRAAFMTGCATILGKVKSVGTQQFTAGQSQA